MILMLLVWRPHFESTGLSHYQLLRPTYGLAYQAIETRSFLPQGRSGQSETWGRAWISVGGGEMCQETEVRGVGWGYGGPGLPSLWRSGSGTGGRQASLGKVWGRTEQRLGLGRGPSAPDLWGWKQWLGRCCLALGRGTSLFSFPAPIFPSSPPSLPLQQAHPVRWPLDSTFLHADLFAAASTRSHSEVGNKAGDRGDVGGRSGGPPQGPDPGFRD